ncbi:MAG: pyridoxal phosphate-dependent aminotransferase [Deferribacteraceae bacterium]|jgi:aspartate/methionine/tyrosine aminotransferase|nr:pyridoxal phosphate-dependent aminotransferase [Deferribacteraceae bacterium]
MRFDFAKAGSGLTYEIRNIVEVANHIKSFGKTISWNNIGDPIMKGERVPEWMKETLKKVLDEDMAYAYSPTKGVDSTREYLASVNNKRGGAQITKDDIIFFNGLGDAVARAYAAMQGDGRVILPAPTYSTHFMAEVLHASYPPNTFSLDPYDNWKPNIEELEEKVQHRPGIVGIMIINPCNPTGYVYPEDTLREIVRIAKENDLFLMFDEIYNSMVFYGKSTPLLSDIIGDVPGISMKSLSKEVPWPGGRCGWIEVYNSGKDAAFDRFIKAIYQQKMAEVCSATFPQMALPIIYEHPEFPAYLQERIDHYQKLAEIGYTELNKSKYLQVNELKGTFYMTAVFKEGVLNGTQTLPTDKPAMKTYIESRLSSNAELDKRFAYYLLASEGICVVPLTSFFAPINGFRVTLLDKDIDQFVSSMQRIARAADAYVESSKI